MRVLFAVAAGLSLATAASAAPKTATPPATPALGAKTPGACNTKLLPMSVGNSWTYTAVRAPFDATEQIAKISPLEPKTVVVTVKSIEKKGADNVITLDEKSTYNTSKDEKKPSLVDRTIETTITCRQGQVRDLARQLLLRRRARRLLRHDARQDRRARARAGSWPTAASAMQKWREDVDDRSGRVRRRPSSNAKLDRRQDRDRARVHAGAARARRDEARQLDRGEARPHDHRPRHARRRRRAAPSRPSCRRTGSPHLARADGVGVVQLLNPYAHMYQLTAATLNN